LGLTLAIFSMGLVGVAIPAALPVTVLGAGTGLYAWSGGQFLLGQSESLAQAEQKTRLARLTGNLPESAVLEKIQDELRAMYQTSEISLQFTTDGRIYHHDRVIYVDALVAYYLREESPYVLHSILAYHEPSHALGASERIAYSFQAFTSPLYFFGSQKTGRWTPFVAALAPLLLPLALLHQFFAALFNQKNAYTNRTAVESSDRRALTTGA
jgi:hypothetical protein